MDNFVANNIILPMLTIFYYSRATFHYPKLFHLTLFMVIYNCSLNFGLF